MDVVILGAGRPARGDAPAALTPLARATRGLDWQLGSLRTLPEPVRVTFIGGFGIERVASLYPGLDYVVVPDWEASSILHSLLRAPLSGETLIAYADTVFHDAALSALLADPAEVVFGYDSGWRTRYPERTDADVAQAERVTGTDGQPAEFTGLLYLRPRAAAHLRQVAEAAVGRTVPDLIEHLRRGDFVVAGVDLKGRWAEFNDPRDIARFVLGTKADTLARLAGRVTKSRIEPPITFTSADWADRRACLARISSTHSDGLIIVRSSSAREDGWTRSGAGQFASRAGIDAADQAAVAAAVDAVVASYDDERDAAAEQVLVQRQVADVRCAGVVLTCGLTTGAPYYRINLDSGGATDVVTGGGGNTLRTLVVWRDDPDRLETLDPALVQILDAVREVETLIAYDRLDVEFAVDGDGTVHVFQVRPVVVDHAIAVEPARFTDQVGSNVAQFERLQVPAAGIVGGRTIFGVMPDWNPAEVIGTRPRPLALDLYRYLVTDTVWAGQRAEFGYRDVRSQALLASFAGQPYVDVRASLNSFVPAEVDDEAAARIVEAGVAILAAAPELHDKLEFAVAFTVWDPNLERAASERYAGSDVRRADIAALAAGLKRITRAALTRLEADLSPLAVLARREAAIIASAAAPGDRALALIADCATFGTPAFAHAARAGFVAMTLLDRLTAVGALSAARRQDFLLGLNTVSQQLRADLATRARTEVLARYGHLRPGTYEVTAPAYWEDPDRFLAPRTGQPDKAPASFALSKTEMRWVEEFLTALDAPLDPTGFTAYLQAALEARERGKFDFTRSLSRALDLLVTAAPDWGLTRDDLSFLRLADLRELAGGAMTAADAAAAVSAGRRRYRLTELTELPPLLRCAADFHGFEQPASAPNFITLGTARGPVADAGAAAGGAIVLLPRADPGFDWLFGRGIAGLITCYGGANSHMAIRAAELGLPAAIGVGEQLYERIEAMRSLELDCAQRTIREIV